MRTRRFALLLMVFALSMARALAAQSGADAATLRVTGDVTTALTLSAAELKAMPRTRVTTRDADGALTYEGVLVSDLLRRAGLPMGAELRGAALAAYVVASAPDGYQVVFSVGELDPTLSGQEVIVADSVDGRPLAANQGPFRIVVARDTRPARSVRMVERLDVVRLRK